MVGHVLIRVVLARSGCLVGWFDLFHVAKQRSKAVIPISMKVRLGYSFVYLFLLIYTICFVFAVLLSKIYNNYK